MMVISPHYDDAVYSLGGMLAATDDRVTILTAFSGQPAEGLCTEYDRACGFATSVDAMKAREDEDRRACLVLDVARRIRLDWLDHQYAMPVNDMAMKLRLRELIRENTHVVAPLGIAHPDHSQLAAAALGCFADAETFWVYEELPYRVHFPEFTAEALDGIRALGLTAALLPEQPHDDGLKRAAVACYRSQLDDVHQPALFVPERIWQVTV